MKMPAFQFYPADWRKDPGVQALNRHDRSVWFDMLCIMHESDERGVLLLAGRPTPESALAAMLGLDNQTFNQTLTTILTYGVASRRESDGAIYCRRMVKDETLCQLRREAGKKGGNPNLVNQKGKQKPTTQDKQIPTPSSSTSSSTSSSEDEREESSSAAGPEPLKAEKPTRKLPPPPDDAELFTPDNWMGLTNPATFAAICTDLRLPIDLDRETYRAVIQDKMRSLKMEAIASTMRSWISGFFVNEKKKGPLLTLTAGLPTKPTPKAELPRPGQEQPGQVLAFEGESDDYVNRTRMGNYQRQWPAATIHIITPRQMSYDAENLAYLEGEARAAAHWLGLALKPVVARNEAELAAFNMQTATSEEARRLQDLRSLLAAMQSYCEAAGLLNAQLSANATAAEETAHREASRAATFLHEIRLMHGELQAERALSAQQYETFQTLLRRAA